MSHACRWLSVPLHYSRIEDLSCSTKLRTLNDFYLILLRRRHFLSIVEDPVTSDEADHLVALGLEELEEDDAVVEAEDLDSFDSLRRLDLHRFPLKFIHSCKNVKRENQR